MTKVRIIILLLILLMLCACVPGDGKNNEDNKAGIFSGIWHGLIAPISLILSIFKHRLSIYEVHNNGFWYNLGYYVAVISGWGTIRFSRKH
ncbi:MAG TPA: hypothetical protein PL063_04650 [Candidatus Cloacimonadota bacterium]|nr:hypothetical protein [Candidatus Cloacimonadota bacterium]HQB41721.1 hypothetical protein [Candidatus Cloacimonadota bacterium]